MPIKPENRHRYPADWLAIRDRILARAGHRCEHPGCLARQYSIGIWHRPDGGAHQWAEQYAPPATYAEARSIAADAWWEVQHLGGDKLTIIVLTIAHLDHQPENCDEANLRALCQRHHLAHDHAHHQANSQATRRARKAMGDLFETSP